MRPLPGGDEGGEPHADQGQAGRQEDRTREGVSFDLLEEGVEVGRVRSLWRFGQLGPEGREAAEEMAAEHAHADSGDQGGEAGGSEPPSSSATEPVLLAPPRLGLAFEGAVELSTGKRLVGALFGGAYVRRWRRFWCRGR